MNLKYLRNQFYNLYSIYYINNLQNHQNFDDFVSYLYNRLNRGYKTDFLGISNSYIERIILLYNLFNYSIDNKDIINFKYKEQHVY